MRIALITFEFYPDIGGISRHLTSFCEAIQKTDHTLYVFNRSYEGNNIFNVLDEKEYSLGRLLLYLIKRKLIYYFILTHWKIFRDKKMRFSHKLKIFIYSLVKPKLFIRSLINVKILYPFFKKYNFDLIIGGASGSKLLMLIFPLSRLFNKKVISWAHGNEFLVKSKFSLKTYFLKNLDKIILANHKTKDLIKKIHNINEKEIALINYGLTLKDYELNITREQLREELNISRNCFVILSVGRHVTRKKFDLVIRALNQIQKKKQDLDIRYYLIGEGPETSNLKRLVKNLGLEKQVFFLGLVDNYVRNKYYKISDVFLMPSIEEKESIEGFGLVFLEANYYNVPVIGTPSGGITEAIENMKNGMYVNPNDENDITDKILFLYENREKRAEMGLYGHDRVVSQYNWEIIINEYTKLFEDLQDRKK